MAGLPPQDDEDAGKPKETGWRYWLRVTVTMSLGIGAGLGVEQFGIPLPYMVGTLFITLLLSLSRVRLAVPNALRVPTIGIIAVLLGSKFKPEIVDQLPIWGISFILMIASSVILGLTGYFYARYIARLDIASATFAGIPGGLTMMTLLAPIYGADIRAVGLMHGMRVFLLMFFVPIIAGFLTGTDVGEAARTPPELLPSGWQDWAVLLGSLVFGLWGGKLLKLPLWMMTGPLILSAALHIAGISTAEPPEVFIIPAQLVLGALIGVSFYGVRLSFVGKLMAHGTGLTVILVAMSFALTYAVHLLIGYRLDAMILAYLPGGAPEMALVALALGIDPAFVTTHHIVRILVVVGILPPLLAKLIPKKENQPKHE